MRYVYKYRLAGELGGGHYRVAIVKWHVVYPRQNKGPLLGTEPSKGLGIFRRKTLCSHRVSGSFSRWRGGGGWPVPMKKDGDNDDDRREAVVCRIYTVDPGGNDDS